MTILALVVAVERDAASEIARTLANIAGVYIGHAAFATGESD